MSLLVGTTRRWVILSQKCLLHSSSLPVPKNLSAKTFGALKLNAVPRRQLSGDDSAKTGSAESKLVETIRSSFPNATDIAVVDISGGCGSMYEVFVEAPEFKGVRMVKQHQMVTNALKTEIKDMHGLRISTGVSPCK